MYKTGLDTYEKPMVKVISVEIEQGFATSNNDGAREIDGWGDGGSWEDSFDI